MLPAPRKRDPALCICRWLSPDQDFAARSEKASDCRPVAVLASGSMSEKRHRQQQRRQRRKATGRPPAKPSGRDGGSPGANGAEGELSELLAGMAAVSVRQVHVLADGLEAEQWASTIIGAWHARPMPGQDVDAMFFPGFVDVLEQLGTARALTTLRALAAVGAGAHGQRASAAAQRLAMRGLTEPPWAAALGQAQPTAAALMSEDAFDDGLSVMVEYAGPGCDPHTLGVYIDHNMGGLVKDIFLAGPLAEVRSQFNRHAPNHVGLVIRDVDLAEARARVEAALYMLDHTYDPPVNEDVRLLRALVDARMRLLPKGFELPEDGEEVTPQERDALLADFLSSPNGQRWHGDEDAEDVAQLAIDFGAGYNHGGPLRWSPVVVEIFMTSWLARKVTREPEFFVRVPDVLRDWVKYAGRRQRVPAAPLDEAVAAVESYRDEMLDAVSDPEAWGPAKSFAVAALDAGVDLTDNDELQRFMKGYNDGMAA
jgi:hypothetical protein